MHFSMPSLYLYCSESRLISNADFCLVIRVVIGEQGVQQLLTYVCFINTRYLE